MVWGLKSVILSTAPIPDIFVLRFLPSNFPAAAILNYDVTVQCRAQATAMADEKKFQLRA